MSDLVGNPEDRFSHNEAHIKLGAKQVAQLQKLARVMKLQIYQLEIPASSQRRTNVLISHCSSTANLHRIICICKRTGFLLYHSFIYCRVGTKYLFSGRNFFNCFLLTEYMYSQTCVKRPYKTRHVFGFSDRWLLIAA